MQSISAQNVDVKVSRNRSEGDEWVNKCYRSTIRRFKGGRVEVSSRCINGIQYKKYAESIAMGGVLRMSRPEPQEMTLEQREAAALEKARENHERSVRRARQQVRFSVKAIGADHLLTLTYRVIENEPMTDVEKLKADWKRFCRIVKTGLPACRKLKAHRGLPEWKFVSVREPQDSGSLHLHVAVVGRQDINYIRRCWYVAIGGNQDDSGERTLGQVNVKGPSKRWGTKMLGWKPDNLASYMTKYLHKTFDEFRAKGEKRYWAGRSNDKPEVVKVWLGAQCFRDAILESHALYCHETWEEPRAGKLWASENYDSIWLAG